MNHFIFLYNFHGTHCRKVEINVKDDCILLERKMNIKNLVLEYIRYEQLNWYGHVRRMNEKRIPKKNWKKEKRKILKFEEAGSNNRNEREGN